MSQLQSFSNQTRELYATWVISNACKTSSKTYFNRLRFPTQMGTVFVLLENNLHEIGLRSGYSFRKTDTQGYVIDELNRFVESEGRVGGPLALYIANGRRYVGVNLHSFNAHYLRHSNLEFEDILSAVAGSDSIGPLSKSISEYSKLDEIDLYFKASQTRL